MADLHEKLPVIMQGRETEKPIKPAPSLFETIATFGANAIQAVEQGNANHAAGMARRRQAAKDAEEAREDAAKNAAAVGAADTMLVAAAAARQAAPGLLTQQEAEAQGRGVGPGMGRIKAEATIRQLIAAHPGEEFTILNTLKEFGITSMVMKEYERAESALDSQQTAELKREEEIASVAQNSLGLDWNNMTDAERIKFRPSVLKYMQGIATLEQAQKQASINASNATLTREQREMSDEQESSLRVRGFLDTMNARIDPLIRSVTQAYNNPNLSEAERDKQVSDAVRFLQTELPRQFTQNMGLYGARMSEQDRNFVQEQFDRQMKSLTELLSGPASLVESNKRQLSILTDKMGIDIHQSMQFWSYLKSSVGGETLKTLFSNEILGDPTVMKRLKDEFRMAENLAPGEERLRFQNVVQILRGEKKLNDLSDPREAAPLVLQTMNAMSKNSMITNGSDKESHREFMTAIGEASSVAVEANVQWGFNNLMKIGQVFLQQGVIRGLAQTAANTESRTEAINQYQPALQNVYMSLSQASSGDKFHTLQWDNASASWKIKWNGEMVDAKGGLPLDPKLRGAGAVGSRVRPRPSDSIVRQAQTLNKIIEVQSALAGAGWDPVLKGKGVPDRERRLYYGRGVMPEALRQERAKTKSQDQNIKQLIEGFYEGLNSTPPYQTGDIVDAIDEAEGRGKNPRSSAEGVGNFIDSTWLSVVRKHRPELVEGKSPEQILALRSDPVLGKEMIEAYAEDNKAFLQSKGISVGAREISLAHFTGPQGALKALVASLDDKVVDVLGAAVVAANPFLKDWNIKQLLEWAGERVGL